MGTRSFAQVAPTPATIALNAYIFGYGGHSLVTPHAALKQLWWTDKRIEAKVTRSFVVSKLRGEERQFLNRPLAFGEGLTDDTYLEWILGRAKRLFLILAEIGVPDQIFGCIDDSWDDEDLPIPLEDVASLELAYENDEALNKKFYDTQFIYLLRELSKGAHIEYGPKEHIPMEHVSSLPPAVSLQVWDRVHFPDKPEEMYMRRKLSLIDKSTGHDFRFKFTRDVKRAQALAHEHLATAWASYTTENSAYIISDFVGEHTLSTFIDHRMPAQFQRVPPAARPVLLCEWMHCLSDVLAFLHHSGTAHTAIRPSNVIIDKSNRIAFADIGNLKTFQRGKKVNKMEIYDYAAPETHLSKYPVLFASSPPVSSKGAFNKLRKMSSSNSSSSDSSVGSSTRSNSMCTIASTTTTPPSTGRSNSMTTTTSINTLSPLRKSSAPVRNFSRHLAHQSIETLPDVPASPTSTSRVLPTPTIPDPDLLRDLPAASPEMSDVFSLACIFLDIITFMIKGKGNDFVKFRTTRLGLPVSNGKRARNDSSFHANSEKIDTWIDLLKDDAGRHAEQIFHGVPGLLELIRRMMAQNATMRPTALEVRDRIKQILAAECGVETLCCANREWVKSSCDLGPDTTSDLMSVATGITTATSRTDSNHHRTVSQCDEPMSPLSRTESNITNETSRRGSLPSNSVPRASSWRRVFSRLS